MKPAMTDTMIRATYTFDPDCASVIPDEGAIDGPSGRAVTRSGPLDQKQLELMHRYWQAANYLTVGQIYLQDNPLLREPLAPEHIKPRLLGHWGTSPGLSLLYVHLNRLIRERDAERHLSRRTRARRTGGRRQRLPRGDVHRDLSRTSAATRRDCARLFRQFSTPGGIPSHVSVPTPGSIHEGGELGYVLSHAFGAAFDNPDLIVVAVVGDGEAETGAARGLVEGHELSQSRARRRGAADSASQRLQDQRAHRARARSDERSCDICSKRHGYEVHVVEGDDPALVHQRLADALDCAARRIRAIQRRGAGAPARRTCRRPRWPAIVLRTPERVDGTAWSWTAIRSKARSARIRCRCRTRARTRTHLAHARGRGCAATSRSSSSTSRAPGARARRARARGRRDAWARTRTRTAASSLAAARPPDLPRLRRRRAERRRPCVRGIDAPARRHAPRHLHAQRATQATSASSAPTRRTRIGSASVFEVENRCLVGRRSSIDDHVSPDGRVMEVLSEHLCEGWLEGYLLTGRHGLLRDLRVVRHGLGVDDGAAREVAGGSDRRCRGARRSPSLNILLTSTCWRNDHNGFSHQGPGLIDVMLSKRGTVARIYLPPDANCLLSVADHCLPLDELREPHRHRQAAAAPVAVDGRRDASTRTRRVDLGVGRATIDGRRAGRRARLRRRHADARDRGRGVVAAPASRPSCASAWSTSSTS